MRIDRAAYLKAFNALDRLTPESKEIHWLLEDIATHEEELYARVLDLEDLVDDLTLQATHCMDGRLDSGALTAYAAGLRDMAERGRVHILREFGRRVIAEEIPEDEDD